MKRWTKCKHFIWSGAWKTKRYSWDLMVWRTPMFPWGGWRARAVNRISWASHQTSGFKTRRGAMRWATDVAAGKRTP